MSISILIVDDNKDIIDLLKPHFEKEHFDVTVAHDGLEAYNLFNEHKHNLILLDIMMPKMDGITLCKKIRETSNVPIIMITAKSEDEDFIMGIEVGADDYIVKPFSPRQVIAKVKALIRRLEIVNNNDKILTIDNLTINMDEYTLSIDENLIPLTKKEIEIVYLMAKHPSRIYSRETLLDTLWGDDYFGDIRTVDTHIKRIRGKLNLNNNKYNWDIKTVWGVGYKFEREVK
ncbi:MAG: response regulator transcription factor [Ignavibacteriales bacterium]